MSVPESAPADAATDAATGARVIRLPARAGAGAGRLRVGLGTSDPAARAGLAARVEAAGHLAAPPEVEADVWLVDGTAPDAAFGDARTPVLLLGEADDGGAVPGAVPADSGAVVLDAALRAVAAGLVVRAPEASARRGFGPAEPARALLTPREVDILACLSDGLSNKAAARRLGISAHTVKFHLEAVFAKLGAVSRAEAVAKGLRRGLIEL